MGIGVLGAGRFATTALLPFLARARGVRLVGVCTATGAKGEAAARRFGFAYATTEEERILEDPRVDAVVVATPHRLHARQVVAALRAGKDVFCEKPLCLSEGELGEIVKALRSSGRRLVVGHNRRFSPMALGLRKLLEPLRGPFLLAYRVNGGPLPTDSWVGDPEEGGGRILGECTHFFDLFQFLLGSLPRRVRAQAPGLPGARGDDFVALVEYGEGSLATLLYATAGDPSRGKERLELYGAGATARLEDFRVLEWRQGPRTHRERKLWRAEKGHREEVEAFVEMLRRGGAPPVPVEEAVAATLTALRTVEALRSGASREVRVREFLESQGGS